MKMTMRIAQGTLGAGLGLALIGTLAPAAFAAQCPQLAGTYEAVQECVMQGSQGARTGSLTLMTDSGPASQITALQPDNVLTITQTDCALTLNYVDDYYGDGSWTTPQTAALAVGRSTFDAGAGKRVVSVTPRAFQISQNYRGKGTGASAWKQTFRLSAAAGGNLLVTSNVTMTNGTFQEKGRCVLVRKD